LHWRLAFFVFFSETQLERELEVGAEPGLWLMKKGDVEEVMT